MYKKTVSGVMLTLLLISTLTLAFNIQSVKASETIYIRADGSVYPSTAPIKRDGNIYTFTGNIYDSIVVQRDNIVVYGAGYTVQGTGAYNSIGIDLTGRSNVTIKNMEIIAFHYGIYLVFSSNNSISGNNITYNGDGGIYLDSSSDNSISGNSITNNGYSGIYLVFSSNNSISGNDITENYGDGICLDFSSNNSISGNNITHNFRGIYFYSSSDNSISGNDITYNVGDGIYLVFSSDNSISGNDITNNFLDIGLYSSSNNSISGNNITNDGDDGGIGLVFSSNNTISGNSITNNGENGIRLGSSSNNKFYHNNFIANTRQVYIETSGYANVWDDGYPSGGNYWSDYAGVDFYSGLYQNETGSDEMGDTPRILDADNQDRYPLMNLWTPVPVHDVAVNNVILSETKVIEGDVVNINVAVKNEGTVSEIFNVSAFYDGNVIQTQTDVTLNPSIETVLAFSWNTSGVPGNHQISAEASVVAEEIDTSDNAFVNGFVEVVAKVDTPVKGGENATIVGNVTITNTLVTENALHFDASGPSGSTGWINVTFPMVNTTDIKVFINQEKLTPPPFPIITTNETHYFIYFEFTLSTHNIAIQFAPSAPPVPVGGYWIPINKLALLTPWISLLSLTTTFAISLAYVKHKKKQQD